MAINDFWMNGGYLGATVKGFVEPRIAEKELLAYDVMSYGATNSYPQEAEYAYCRSSIASACVQKLCEFLYGEGFNDNATALAVVNDKGDSLDELLYQVTQQMSLYNGFALLLNANILGQYTSIEIFPFEYVRLGIPNEDGELTHARVWDNWAGQSPRQTANLSEIYSIDLFNPLDIQEGIERCGGIENYKGQILYFTTNNGYYSRATFDSAFEQVLATGNIPVFTNNYIKNGFSSSALISRKDIETDEQRALMQAQFQGLSGIRNAGGIGVVEGDFELLDISSTQQLDKQYVEINERIKHDVIEVYQIPPILLGVNKNNGFPNKDELENAFTYYNSQTRMYRRMIAKQFAEIASNFVYFIGDDFTIEETKFDTKLYETPEIWQELNSDEKRAYITKEYDVTLSTPESKTKENGKASTENESDNPEQAKAQAQLRGSVGGVQGILQIADNFKRGIINETSATTILEEIYGFSNIIAREILGI